MPEDLVAPAGTPDGANEFEGVMRHPGKKDAGAALAGRSLGRAQP